MRQNRTRPAPLSKLDYFTFSVEYLVLTSIIYAALIMAPYAALKSSLQSGLLWLLAIPLGLWLLHGVLNSHFTAINKPPKYAAKMTLITILPPIIGPVIVLLRSLE